MAADDSVYVVDSSSWLLIQGHPRSNQILHALGGLLEANKLKSPPEVFQELKTVDAITSWIKANKKDIQENKNNDVAFLLKVGEVAAAFPGMVAIRGRKEKADPMSLPWRRLDRIIRGLGRSFAMRLWPRGQTESYLQPVRPLGLRRLESSKC